MSFDTSFGAGRPGNERGGDDDVLLLDVIGDERRLLRLVLFRHFLGVAGGGFRLLEFLVLDRDEFRAEALHLFLDGRAHVGRGHDGAETARRRNRLQAGDADAHHEDLGGGHGAGRGHHHRERAAEFPRRVDHRAIAGEIGLARQHVHRLRARDARHQFHGKRNKPRIGKSLDRGFIAVGIHDGGDERAFLVAS